MRHMRISLGLPVMLLGALFTLLMVAVSIALAAKVVGQTFSTKSTLQGPQHAASAAQAQAGADGKAAAERKHSVEMLALPMSQSLVLHLPPADTNASADNGDKDALANAMSAIGATVAVVALLLTLGTTWLGELLRRVEDRFEALAAKDRQAEMGQRADAALVRAQVELGVWLNRQDLTDPGSLEMEWSRHLQALRIDDNELRFQSYHTLREALSTYAEKLPYVADYCLKCHELAVARIQYLPDGKQRPMREVSAETEKGLWCLIFDAMELQRYKRVMERT